MDSGIRLRVLGLLDADSQRSTVIHSLVQLGGGIAFGDAPEFVRSVWGDTPDCVAVGALSPHGGTNALLVGRLRRDHPRVGVVAVCDTSPAAVQQLLHLARAGADEVVLTSMATPAELSATVERACARRRETSVWHRVAPLIPTELHDIVQFCFTNSIRRRSVGELAQHVGIDRSTLATRLRRAGLPPAHTILSWSRLIAVAELIESSRMSIERAALMSGFDSAAGLRTLTRRLVGVGPRAVADSGGGYVLERFLAVLDPNRKSGNSET